MPKPYLSPEGNIAITHANGFVEMVPAMTVESFTDHPEIKDAFCLVVREKKTLLRRKLFM